MSAVRGSSPSAAGWGIAGIGYGSVVAQYLGVALAAVLIVANYREFITRIDWSAVFDMRPIRRFLVVNRDIIVRTLCIVAVYTFFTGASARMEDRTLLAVNTILLQLFTLFSYMTDGFAQAAEARKAGVVATVLPMSKNMKHQIELLEAEGFTKFEKIYE